jgi:hypothetical protein
VVHSLIGQIRNWDSGIFALILFVTKEDAGEGGRRDRICGAEGASPEQGESLRQKEARRTQLWREPAPCGPPTGHPDVVGRTLRFPDRDASHQGGGSLSFLFEKAESVRN